jgi:hypothetical protein
MTMTTYRVSNVTSGSTLGEYQAESQAEALDMASRDAGYESFEAACVAMVDRDKYDSDEDRQDALAKERADVRAAAVD